MPVLPGDRELNFVSGLEEQDEKRSIAINSETNLIF